MKEDKENTRPKEKKVEIKCEENEKTEKPNKEKKEAMTKVASLLIAAWRAVSFLASSKIELYITKSSYAILYSIAVLYFISCLNKQPVRVMSSLTTRVS